MDPQAQQGQAYLQPKAFGQQSIYQVARELKKEQHTLFNCLASILSDAAFIQEIKLLYPDLPLVANLRAGGWYAPSPDGTCYFKSTDGHQNNCNFSVTRLNWHVAELATQKGGVIIVDATRKGKRFPDAMSKTIPIWAAVLNRAVARVRAYDAQKAQRRRTYAAANGEVFTAVADTQTTISVRGDDTSPAGMNAAVLQQTSAAAQAQGAAYRAGTQQQQLQQLQTPDPNDNAQTQPVALHQIQQQQPGQQQALQCPEHPQGQSHHTQQEDQQQDQQARAQVSTSRSTPSAHTYQSAWLAASAAASADCNSSTQVVQLLADCLGPSVDLMSGYDSTTDNAEAAAATSSAASPGYISSPAAVATPEPGCGSNPQCAAAAGATLAGLGPAGASCCCMHRSKSVQISPQPSLHEWLDEMDVLRRLTLLADSRAAMRPVPRVSCPQGCGCAGLLEGQPRAVPGSEGRVGTGVASAPAVSCLLAAEDSAPVTPVAGTCCRGHFVQDVSVFEDAAAGSRDKAAGAQLTAAAAGLGPTSAPLPAVGKRAAAVPVLEGIGSPAFLLAAGGQSIGVEAGSTGEPVTPRLVFGTSTGSTTSSSGSSGRCSSGDDAMLWDAAQEQAAVAAVPPAGFKQLRFAEQAPVGDVPAAPEFAFPSQHQLAASAGSSVGAEAAGHLAASGMATSGSSCDSGLVRLPDMPVVVLNGTSHQPGDAASILDIWRGTDLEDVACLPGISDFMPGVYHLPTGSRQPRESSVDDDYWPAAAQQQQPQQKADQQRAGSDGPPGNSGSGPATSWAAEVCLRSQQQLSGRLSVSNWLDDDETGAVCDALCAFAAPALSPSCCSTSGSTEEVATSCCSAACGSQGSGSVCSEDSRPSSRQSSTTAGFSSSVAAGPLAESSSAGSVSAGAPAAAGAVGCGAPVEWDTALHLPLWVSAQEREAIEAKLDGWVERLLEVGADVRGLAAVLTKPLRPLWVSQSSLIWTNQVAHPSSLPFTPLLLVSASQPHAGERQAVRSAWLSLARGPGASPERPLGTAFSSGALSDASSDDDSCDSDEWDGLELDCSWGSCKSKRGLKAKVSAQKHARKRSKAAGSGGSSSGSSKADLGSWSYVYVPGAGDDEESWAAGLTPALFWQHCDALVRCGPANIKPAVKQLLQMHKSACYGSAAASLAAAAVRGLAAAPPSSNSSSSSARPPSPLGLSSSSSNRGGCSSGAPVLTDRHHPAPQGCGGAQGGGPVHVVTAAPGAFWVGNTGLAVGNLEGACAADVWRSFDAVLCCGTAMVPVLQGEYNAMRLAAAKAPAAPAAAVLSSSAPCSLWVQQSQQHKEQQLQQQVKAGAGERALSSSFCNGSSAAHSHWVRQQQLAAAAPADSTTAGSQEHALEFNKVVSAAPKKPARKSGMLSALLSKAMAAGAPATTLVAGSSSDSTAAPGSPTATSAADLQACGSDASSVAGSCASSVCSSSYYSVCSEDGGPAGACGGYSSGSRSHLPRLKWLPVECAKRDRSSFKQHLQEALEFVSAHLVAGHTVLLHDVEGHDNCVCMAVAVLSGCFAPAAGADMHNPEPAFVGAWLPSHSQQQQQQQPQPQQGEPHLPATPVSKQSVRQQLAIVSSCYPLARPTRGMLKQVFNFFEDRRRDSGVAC